MDEQVKIYQLLEHPNQRVKVIPSSSKLPIAPIDPSKSLFTELPYETILQILTTCTTWDLFLLRRLCSSAYRVTEGNKKLWKGLYFPKMRNRRLTLSIIKLGIGKSNERLRELVITTGAETRILKQLQSIIETTSWTLKLLDLKITRERSFLRRYTEFSKKCPNLKVYRFWHLDSAQIAILKWDRVTEGYEEDPELLDLKEGQKADPVPLKVLWVWDITPISHNVPAGLTHWAQHKPYLYPRCLEALTSLRVELPIRSHEWHKILEAPSHTLKHLEISIRNKLDYRRNIPFDPAAAEEAEPRGLDPVHFPNLVILKLLGPLEEFPDWLRPPPDVIFFSANIWTALPPIREMWVKNVSKWERIIGRCDNLRTLRYTYRIMKAKEADTLIAMLDARAEAFLPIRTLVVPFRTCTAAQLERFRKRVDEVLDLSTVPEGVDVTVE